MTTPPDYRETLHVPVSWWLIGLGLVVAVWWAFFVATPWFVAIAAAVLAALIVGTVLGRYGAVRVAVDGHGLRAGRATLAWPYVGAVETLDDAGVRRVAGVEADARAYLVLRGYCGAAVRVRVDDERDPTPYWLVSTRHPAELAARLTAPRVQD